MSKKVVFFTRSGYTKSVAEKIARRLDCGLVQITDNKNWKGIVGFIRGGYYSSQDKEVVITVHGQVEPGDELVVVAPMWAGKLAPAVREFLKDKDRGKVRCVVTSNGTSLKDRAGFRSVTDVVRRFGDEDQVLDRFFKEL